MTTFDGTGQRVSREALVGEHRRGSRVRTTPAGTWFPAVDPHGNPAGLLLVHPGVDVKVLVPTLARLVELQLPGVLPPRAQLNNQAGRNWLITDAAPVPVLSEVLDDEGPHRLPANAAVLLSDLAATLATLHQSGVVHGRLAANSVVIGQGGTALLTDFGTKPDARSSDDVAAWTQLARLLAEKWCAEAPEAAAALARAVGATAGNGLAAGYDQLRELAADGRRDLLAQLAAGRLADGAKPKPIRKRVRPALPPELAELEDDEPPARRSLEFAAPGVAAPEPATPPPAAPPTVPPTAIPEPPSSETAKDTEPRTGRQPMRPDQLIRSQQLPSAPPRQSGPRESVAPAAPAQPAESAQPDPPAEPQQPAAAQSSAPPRTPARPDQPAPPQPPTRPEHTDGHQQPAQPAHTGGQQAVRPDQTGGFPRPVQSEQHGAPPARTDQTGPHQWLAPPPTRPEYTGPQPPVRPDQAGPHQQPYGPPYRPQPPSDASPGQPQRPLPGPAPRRFGMHAPLPPPNQPPTGQPPAGQQQPPTALAASAPPAQQRPSQPDTYPPSQPTEQAAVGLSPFESAPQHRPDTREPQRRQPDRPEPDRWEPRRTDQRPFEPSPVEQTERLAVPAKPAQHASPIRSVLIGVLIVALAIASALLYLRIQDTENDLGLQVPQNPTVQAEQEGTVCMIYASLVTNGQQGTLKYRWIGDQNSPNPPVESVSISAGEKQVIIGKQWLVAPGGESDPDIQIQLLSPSPHSASIQPASFCQPS